jgi:hypothetical protein
MACSGTALALTYVRGKRDGRMRTLNKIKKIKVKENK